MSDLTKVLPPKDFPTEGPMGEPYEWELISDWQNLSGIDATPHEEFQYRTWRNKLNHEDIMQEGRRIE